MCESSPGRPRSRELDDHAPRPCCGFTEAGFPAQRIRSTTVNVRGVERKAVELRAPRPTLTQLDISPNLAQPIPTEDVDG
jgi:hypothetical protein